MGAIARAQFESSAENWLLKYRKGFCDLSVSEGNNRHIGSGQPSPTVHAPENQLAGAIQSLDDADQAKGCPPSAAGGVNFNLESAGKQGFFSTVFPRDRYDLLACWPGLLRLWVHGDFTGLVIATAFATLLNLSLLSTFVWTEWLGDVFPRISWPIVIAVWIASWWLAKRSLGELRNNHGTIAREKPNKTGDALFIAAQTEYLRGSWSAAQDILLRQLRFNPRDIESRLLLASVYRRNRQWDAARRELDQLTRLDDAQRWQDEVCQLAEMISFEASIPDEEENSGTVTHAA